MVLVDSSIWMEAARRHGRLDCKIALENLIEQGEALIAGPIRMEVLAGARPNEREKLAAGLDLIPYQAMNDQDWVSATEFAARLTESGLSLPFRTVLIASLAIQWDCRVYTLDPSFKPAQTVLGLGLYQPGYGGKFEPDTRPLKKKRNAVQEIAYTPPASPAPPAPAKFSPSNLDIGMFD